MIIRLLITYTHYYCYDKISYPCATIVRTSKVKYWLVWLWKVYTLRIFSSECRVKTRRIIYKNISILKLWQYTYVVYKYELIDAKRERLLLWLTCIIIGSVVLCMMHVKTWQTNGQTDGRRQNPISPFQSKMSGPNIYYCFVK